MKVLSVDVGMKKGALVVAQVGDKFEAIECIKHPFISFKGTYALIDEIFLRHHYDAILIGEAFGQRAVVKQHSKFYGLMEYQAENRGIVVIYVSDRSARAAVLGKGFGNRKDLVHVRYQGSTPDISDAILFAEWYHLNLNK